MGFFAALLNIVKSLPAIVQLVVELSAWLKSQFGDDPAKFLLDSSEAFRKAREAKTPQERTNAAKEIAGLIRRL